jgi:hypothetical protein
MSDAALSEPRAAALKSAAPSNAMKSAAGKTWRRRRTDVWGSHSAPGIETSAAGKTWGDRRADVDACGPAKPMQTAAAGKAGRDRRPDVWNPRAVKLMRIAAAKAAVESAASKPGGDGRGAGVEIRRNANPAGAKAAGRRAGIDRV